MLNASNERDFDAAFENLKRLQAGALVIAGDAIFLLLRVMRVPLGSLGFLCLEVILRCELKHLGTRCRVAEQITSCTTVLGAGAVVLTKSDRFGF